MTSWQQKQCFLSVFSSSFPTSHRLTLKENRLSEWWFESSVHPKYKVTERDVWILITWQFQMIRPPCRKRSGIKFRKHWLMFFLKAAKHDKMLIGIINTDTWYYHTRGCFSEETAKPITWVQSSSSFKQNRELFSEILVKKLTTSLWGTQLRSTTVAALLINCFLSYALNFMCKHIRQ